MNLVFTTLELVATVLAVVIVNFVVQDGETNWLEGLQLLAAYVIMAIAFFLPLRRYSRSLSFCLVACGSLRDSKYQMGQRQTAEMLAPHLSVVFR